MSKKIGNIVVIEIETPTTCEYCGKIEETRPYGINGLRICFSCGMKPENINETKRQFHKFLKG